MAPADYKPILLKRNRTELNLIAKKLKIKHYSHGTKEQLVELIVSSRTPKQIKKVVSPSIWNRYHNHIYGATSILGLVIAVWALIPASRQESRGLPTPTPTPTGVENSPQVGTQQSLSHSPTPAVSPLQQTNVAQFHEKRPQNVPASVHLNRARNLMKKGPKYLSAALSECNQALRIEPGNREAIELRNSIIALKNSQRPAIK